MSSENLGVFAVGSIIYLRWSTNSAAGGAITRAADGSIRIYKNGGTTQRSSSAGITDTEDFDGITGAHQTAIDTSDDTDAGFYVAGANYGVMLAAATVDGQTVNTWLASFTLTNASDGATLPSVLTLELQAEVGYYLGWGRTTTDWSVAQTADVEACVKAGIRQFYDPPAVPIYGSHRWSFLRPVTTLSTVAADGDYDLPETFGSLDGVITYAEDEGVDRQEVVRLTGEARIRALRQESSTSGKPTLAAVRAKTATGLTWQRYELLLWPTPDAVYVLTYRYRILPSTIGGDAYPMGSGVHLETIIASCLAAAEDRINDARGIKYQYFMERLQASIAADLEQQPDSLGYNGNAGSRSVRWSRGNQCTVDGVLYDGA